MSPHTKMYDRFEINFSRTPSPPTAYQLQYLFHVSRNIFRLDRHKSSSVCKIGLMEHTVTSINNNTTEIYLEQTLLKTIVTLLSCTEV